MNTTEATRQLLPPSSKWLLSINTLFAGASALSNTFLNIYLWKFLQSVEQIAIYNFYIFLFSAIGYTIAGWIAKKSDRLYTLRIGVAILALFYILIISFGSRAVSLYVLLGVLQGLGTGFFWLSYNVLVFEVTEPETRDEYNGANGFLFAVATMAAPLLAGRILSTLPMKGYTIIFTVSFALFLTAVLITWKLSPRAGPPSYDLYAGFSPQEHKNVWRKMLTMSFSMGFREGTLAFLPFLLVFVITQDELTASRYLLFTSAGSLLAYYVVKKFLTNARRMTFVTTAAMMLGLSVLLLLFEVNKVSLFVFGIANALFTPLLVIPYSCLTYDVMGQLPEAVHRKVEYIVIREAVVNTGRCLSILALILLQWQVSQSLSLKLTFLLVGLSPLVALFFFRRTCQSLRESLRV
ncbi:YQGE family putative transporter [Tumebacillus sp. BK434]|uniref:MFS transporter n=1 Tax=Tumebacillus sp. BK434 TaxID=2512169 RepID=UPI001045F1AA|nr:MFS transporter [Tumebacillus sp. BK434]TCP58904.1 YQGE family putative transporter [Tumebacillus sp. BK434]